SASEAAAAGGFTTICAMPDTQPVNDVRAVTEQIVTRNATARGARVEPVGAATIGLAGVNLSEMGDLKDAGCVAVATGGMSIANARLMRRVLEYARSVDLPVFTCPLDPSLADGTAIHEGDVSVRLGIEAMPSEAESTALFRDGMLARLAGWKIHAQRISTAQSVEVLRQLKAAGIAVTADCTPHHLWFDDSATTGFDTSTRVSPPLRSASDVEALRAAVAEGLIDAIATDHSPQSSIEKMVEYEWCQPGTVGLETALSLALELVRTGVLTRMQALERLTIGPARVLGRSDIGALTEGARADLCIVDADMPRRVQSALMRTRSRNSIFEGTSLLGHVETTIVGGRLVVGGE
ncbi:MAG: dihydroorotase, partial [Myxococcota bacterium]